MKIIPNASIERAQLNDNKRTCSHCHVKLPISHFNKKRNGEYNKQCNKCNEDDKKYRIKYKCEHGKKTNLCRTCGGSSYCIHDRLRITCLQCSGSQICVHNKRKTQCVENWSL